MDKNTHTPRFKKDYAGRLILLNRNAPEDHSGMFKAGTTARIERRIKARETKLGAWALPGDDAVWWLKLETRCPHCNARHQGFIPEAWVEQGLAVFQAED